MEQRDIAMMTGRMKKQSISQLLKQTIEREETRGPRVVHGGRLHPHWDLVGIPTRPVTRGSGR